MSKNFSIWVFVIAVAVLPIGLYAAVKWYENKFKRLPVLGEKGHTISNFKMINQHGNTITIDNWNDKIVVADFFFTHCPVVCPKMTNSLKQVQEVYGNEENFLINSFSVDPERDTEEKMKAYAERFDIKGDWNLLTGDKKEIYRLARNSFKIVATDGDGGPNDFIHSELLVLIDKQKRIRGYYSGTEETEVKKLINDIKKLKNEN